MKYVMWKWNWKQKVPKRNKFYLEKNTFDVGYWNVGWKTISAAINNFKITVPILHKGMQNVFENPFK